MLLMLTPSSSSSLLASWVEENKSGILDHLLDPNDIDGKKPGVRNSGAQTEQIHTRQ